MFISSLTLQNFRNYAQKKIESKSDTIVIVGPNTSGKTNILEAIFLLSTGKSFRAEKDVEMIRLEEEIARISGETQNSCLLAGMAKLKTEIILTTGEVGGKPAPRKKYLVNGISKRQLDFLGNLRCVLFSPTDLELVTNSPSLRRRYLDFVLTQVDREYRRALLTYEKGLRQRNRLLERIREEGISIGQLTFWNELLIKNGQVLTAKRQELISFINYLPSFTKATEGQFKLIYDQSEINQDRLLKYQKEEIAAGMTLVGPHRDDFQFSIFGPSTKFTPSGVEGLGTSFQFSKDNASRNLSLFGSRGEQRMAILWLKLRELEFVAERSGERPVLLLDDIFSELDEKHRKTILEIIPKQQTIITTTDLHHIEKEYLERVQIIELDN